MVDDLAQVVAALDFVFDLPEDFPDFVFDGVRPAGLLLEAVQVGEELEVDELAEVVAGHRGVVIQLAVLALGSGPAFPAIRLVEDETVFLALQLGLHGLVLLQAIEILQKEEPGGLLGVVQLGGATGFFPQHVVDIFKRLFKHGVLLVLNGCGPGCLLVFLVGSARISLFPAKRFGHLRLSHDKGISIIGNETRLECRRGLVAYINYWKNVPNSLNNVQNDCSRRFIDGAGGGKKDGCPMMYVGHDGKSMPKNPSSSSFVKGGTCIRRPNLVASDLYHITRRIITWWDILIQVVVDFANAHHMVS